VVFSDRQASNPASTPTQVSPVARLKAFYLKAKLRTSSTETVLPYILNRATYHGLVLHDPHRTPSRPHTQPVLLRRSHPVRVQASGFRLQVSGFRLQASGFRLQGFMFSGVGSRLSRVQGPGSRVRGVPGKNILQTAVGRTWHT